MYDLFKFIEVGNHVVCRSLKHFNGPVFIPATDILIKQERL